MHLVEVFSQRKHLLTVHALDHIVDHKKTKGPVHEDEGRDLAEHIGVAWDDLTGSVLDHNVREKAVYKKIPRAEVQARGLKVLRTRWTDINKGDVENPTYQGRFVAMEFNTSHMDGLFAATPPAEALKLLVSDAAAVEKMPGLRVQGRDQGHHGERRRQGIFRGPC